MSGPNRLEETSHSPFRESHGSAVIEGNVFHNGEYPLNHDLRANASQHFRTIFTNAGYSEVQPVPLLSGRQDQSVVFIGSSSNVWKADMKHPPPEGLVLWQPKLRTGNLDLFPGDKPVQFMSHFTGGGILVPLKGAARATQNFLQFLDEAYGVDKNQLLIRIQSGDHDIESMWRDLGVPIEMGGKSASTYQWGFGEEGLSGKGAMLAINHGGGDIREFASAVVVENAGALASYEIGFGSETAIAAMHRLPHPIYASPMIDIMPELSNDQAMLKLADAIYASSAIMNEGVKPGKQGKKEGSRSASTVLDQYMRSLFYLADSQQLNLQQIQRWIDATQQDCFQTSPLEARTASDIYLQGLWNTAGRLGDALRALVDGDSSLYYGMDGGKLLAQGKRVNLTSVVEKYRYPHFAQSKLCQQLIESGRATMDPDGLTIWLNPTT